MIVSDCPAEVTKVSYQSMLIGNTVITESASPIRSVSAISSLGGVETSKQHKEFLLRIANLRTDTDEDAPPTRYAMAMTLSLTEEVIRLMAHRWRLPRIATDGYGGLRLTWKSGKSEVRAVITGDDRIERYLYLEKQDGFGSVKNFTAATLHSYLHELFRDEPV